MLFGILVFFPETGRIWCVTTVMYVGTSSRGETLFCLEFNGTLLSPRYKIKIKGKRDNCKRYKIRLDTMKIIIIKKGR